MFIIHGYYTKANAFSPSTPCFILCSTFLKFTATNNAATNFPFCFHLKTQAGIAMQDLLDCILFFRCLCCALDFFNLLHLCFSLKVAKCEN